MEVYYTSSKSKEKTVGFGTRTTAFVLDVLLLLTLIGVADFLTFSSDDQALLLKPERLLHLLLGWLYFAGAESSYCQGTLGKYLLHLQVTSASGGRLSFKAASIRYFARPLTLVVLLLRFVTDTARNLRQPYHDKLAKARVALR